MLLCGACTYTGTGGESHDVYNLSPISYQLIYRDAPLLAVYENPVSVEVLFEQVSAY